MARIKFSGLVSEMKGKLNGSVLSSNRGGAYIRNNKAGQKNLSAKSTQVKNKFGSLASQWRNLSVEQQEQWALMAPNYPTTNKFGDVRIPSGYELFMRLNGTLQLMNLPLQALPSAPVSLNPLGAVSYDYPDLFQIMPEKGLNLLNSNYPNAMIYVQRTAILGTQSFFDDRSYVLYFKVNNILNETEKVRLLLFDIEGFMNDDEHGIFITFQNGSYLLDVNLEQSSTGYLFSQQLSLGDFDVNIPHVLIVSTSYSGHKSLGIYMDGVFLDNVVDFGSGTGPVETNTRIVFGFSQPTTPNHLTLGGFYQFKQITDAIDARLFTVGYLSQSFEYGCDFSGFDGNTVENFDNPFSLGYLEIVADLDRVPTIVSFTPNFVPAYVLSVENTGSVDEYIDVYASVPQSRGIAGKSSRWVRIGSFIWGSNQQFPLTDALIETFGFIRPNSQVEFYCKVLNITNGQADQAKTSAQRKPRRFKAGSELTDRVN